MKLKKITCLSCGKEQYNTESGKCIYCSKRVNRNGIGKMNMNGIKSSNHIKYYHYTLQKKTEEILKELE